jgi:nucleoside 2-deoxyribosyltransferase
MPRLYIAGPLFNTHERWYLEQIASALETVGYTTYLPHRDAGIIDTNQPLDRVRLFRADLAGLNRCDACVALLTGADHDSGTCGELGYMFAKGKLCIGISDDFRWMNNLIWGLCGEGEQLVKSIDELIPLVERLIPLEKAD